MVVLPVVVAVVMVISSGLIWADGSQGLGQGVGGGASESPACPSHPDISYFHGDRVTPSSLSLLNKHLQAGQRQGRQGLIANRSHTIKELHAGGTGMRIDDCIKRVQCLR